MSAIAKRRAAGVAALMILVYLLQVALIAPSAGAEHIPTAGAVPEHCEKVEGPDLGVEGLEVTVAGRVDVTLHGWAAPEAESNEFGSVMVDVSGLADGELHWQTKAGPDVAGAEVNEGVIVSDGTHVISRAEDASLAISHITLCLFASTEASANLTVVKHVGVVSGDPSTTEFDVSVTGQADVTLGDGDETSFTYDLGAAESVEVTIREHATAESGWSAAISCDDGESGDALVAVLLTDGDEVICTITNTFEGGATPPTSPPPTSTQPTSPPGAPASGTIVIENVTSAAGDDRAFMFSFDGEVFALADGESAAFTDLAAGSYVAAEIQGAASGFSWSIADLTCDDPTADTVVSIDALTDADEVAGFAAIELSAGETVVCTFTNAPSEVLGVTITTAGEDAASTSPGEVEAETLPFTGFDAADSIKLGVLGLLAGVLTLFAVRGPKEEEASVDFDGWANS